MPRSLAAVLLVSAALAVNLPAQTPAQDDSSARAAAKSGTLPLITTRTLKFTTDEGTWISVDVSRDGQRIVFDLAGDLYTMPIGGGNATRITSGPEFDGQPRWSPDGKTILFKSDRSGSDNLWLVDADGSHPRAITKGEHQRYISPAWTPDGKYVVATKGSDLWIWNIEGGTGLRLTQPPRPGATPGPAPSGPRMYMGAAFGPNARYIWTSASGAPPFPTGRDVDGVIGQPSVRTDSESSGRRPGPLQIVQLDRETGAAVVRTEELDGAYRPVASPDGKWLVYATRYDSKTVLKARDLTNGEDHWLVMDAQPDDHEAARERDAYPGSAFTPDSKALITSYGGKIMRVEVPSGRATVIPFTAGVQLALGPLARFDYPIDDSLLTVRQIRGAKPSPDGTKLAFSALDKVWIADLPSQASRGAQLAAREAEVPRAAHMRRLTKSDLVEDEPVWSPDGKWIAYITWSDSTGGDVWRVRSDGSAAPERLTKQSAYYDKIVWSPNGTRIVGMRGSLAHHMTILEDIGSAFDSQLELVWLPASGGDVHHIADVFGGTTQEGRQTPQFGPDSTRVYIYQPSDGLLSIRYDGTDRKALFKVTGVPTRVSFGDSAPPPPQADEVLLAPDGEHALVESLHNVYFVTVPPQTGATATITLTGQPIVPVKRLTKVGGDFIGWTKDGTAAFWSIGHSFFQYRTAMFDSVLHDSTTKYEATRTDVVIQVPKDKPHGIVALRGARLLTMKAGTNEVVENGDLVVRDNRIVALGARGAVDIPAGAHVVDVSGKTIMPGYVDVHAHLWSTWGVHRNSVSQNLAQLAYGVTTQRDPQTSTEDVLTYADREETGEILGPRWYSTGPGIFSSDIITSFDEARDVVRRYADYYDTKTIKQYMVGDRKERQWVIMAARELGLTTTTEGGQDFVMNLTLMQDGYPGLEHSLPIHPLYNDVVKLESFSGITETPTLIVNYGGPFAEQYWLTHWDLHGDQKLRRFTPHDELDKWKRGLWNRDDEYVYPAIAKEMAKLVAAGGRVGMGSHGEVQGVGAQWEVWMLASGGMPAYDVLRVSTIYGAESIGLGKEVGSLEPGKFADLQVLDANPLENIRNTNTIRYVMKNGRLYDAATLDELWPQQKKLPSQWWWRLEPPK